jgi:hypothetical protein
MSGKTHLFLALSRSGWGETAFGIHLAKELHRLGDRCVFFANPSAAPLFAGLPFVYEEVTDQLGGLIKLFLESYLEQNRVGSIVLADFNTSHGVLRQMGLDARFLLKYDVPVVAVDTWSSTESGCAIDVFVNKRKEIGDWIKEVPFRLLPVPIVRPRGLKGACRFLPQPTMPARNIRSHLRGNLGLGEKDRAILLCTAGWQHATYNDPHGERIARAVPELLMCYVKSLGADVHLVHIGPTNLGQQGVLNGRYHWLPSVPVAHFDLLLGSMDLMVSLNVSAATIGKAITSKVPVIVLQNSLKGESADEVLAQLLTRPSEIVLNWIREAVPLYPFRLWPLGFSQFLDPVLERNDYLTAVEVIECLDEQRFLERCGCLLHSPAEREAVQNRQANYVDQVSRLPAPSEVLSTYLGG